MRLLFKGAWLVAASGEFEQQPGHGLPQFIRSIGNGNTPLTRRVRFNLIHHYADRGIEWLG